MLRLSINLLFVFSLFSCDFMDLRPIKYKADPDIPGSVLSDENTPLKIQFNTEMDTKAVEDIFQVNSDFGQVEGDFSWQDNCLSFTPVNKWTAGIRYTYSLTGTVNSIDGRELHLQHFSSFYAISQLPLPLLESHYPADGQSVGINNISLELQFSHSMDRLSVESALSIDGISDKSFEWQDEDKKLIVISKKQLMPWVSYNWNLRDSAKSSGGLPLPKSYSAFFVTDIDKTNPEVAKIYPVIFSNNGWSATGNEIETGLALGESICIEFTKPMDESILRFLRFEPSLPGRAEFSAENKIVYIFSDNPEPETAYTLIISSDAKDTEGLKLENEFQISFTPDIPYLKVLSFNDGNNSVFENLSSGIMLPVTVNSNNRIAVFSLGFSVPFSMEEKQNAAQLIELLPFFPKTIRPIGLQSVRWTSDDRILMQWEGLETADNEDAADPEEAGAAEKNYYVLTIPGRKNGITAGGLFMKEDLKIFLEAKDEN